MLRVHFFTFDKIKQCKMVVAIAVMAVLDNIESLKLFGVVYENKAIAVKLKV